MGTKKIEIIKHTCDRCGDVETIEIDTDVPPHRNEAQRSKGLLVTLSSIPLFTEPAFKRIATANEYPESAQEIWLRLCLGCRGELATFLNAKQ